MNIVIIGAGETGRHVAALFSREGHNVTLVDTDAKRLEQASWLSDLAISVGSGIDWQLLDSFLDLSPDLLVALTSSDQTNFVSCSIAKNLGYPRTIARVRDNRYLNHLRLDFGRIFDVDEFIGPELLVANEIYKAILHPGAIRFETFAHGAVQLRSYRVPMNWRRSDRPLPRLDLPQGVMVALIKRPHSRKEGFEVIFPHGRDCLLPGDEVSLIGEARAMEEMHRFFGIEESSLSSAVIVGGSRTAINLTRLLEKRGVLIRLVEKEYQKCCKLSEMLPHTTIIHHDAQDLEFLLSEKMNLSDAFVVSTHSDDTNLLTALIAKEAGCRNLMIQLSDSSLHSIVNRLEIGYTVSPRMVASNRILSLALSETLTSLVSLYEDQAEIMEIHVSSKSRIAGIPLSELGPLFPKDFLIAMIQNRGRIMVAHGNRIISPGDSVILVSNPKHRQELERIF